MSDDPQLPVQGQVYLALAGAPVQEGSAGLYVRTEQRPGRDEPEHLLIVTRDRIVCERWENPELFAARWARDYTPPVDPDEAHEIRRERDALKATFREVESILTLGYRKAAGTDVAASQAFARGLVAKLRERFVEHRAAAS